MWLAIYSHIGNYWYTHYFYTVLRAKYSMPSWYVISLACMPACLPDGEREELGERECSPPPPDRSRARRMDD